MNNKQSLKTQGPFIVLMNGRPMSIGGGTLSMENPRLTGNFDNVFQLTALDRYPQDRHYVAKHHFLSH